VVPYLHDPSKALTLYVPAVNPPTVYDVAELLVVKEL
jgi:hypothetical protein